MGDWWSVAWRLHDAQFWGVPQRRKRIALVADFGGESAPEILFESKSVSWNIKKSKEKKEEIAGTIGKSTKKTIGRIGCFYPQMKAESQCYREDGVVNTLVNGTNPGFQNGVVYEKNTFTMQAIGEYANCGVSSSLKERDYKDATDLVVYGIDRASFNQGENAKYDFSIQKELAQTIVAKGAGACFHTVVRRLTPLECERLQGYPDLWTDIGEWIDSKGKKHKDADSPRYKALGNSIALPFWQWMAERMTKVLKDDGIENPTMASLFDGIGGFPLVYSRCGVDPIWASEIEEFPIAVTKIHFGEEL